MGGLIHILGFILIQTTTTEDFFYLVIFSFLFADEQFSFFDCMVKISVLNQLVTEPLVTCNSVKFVIIILIFNSDFVIFYQQ